MTITNKKKCDNCKHYHWYYDHCERWDCEMDGRSIHDCFVPYTSNIVAESDYFIGDIIVIDGKLYRAVSNIPSGSDMIKDQNIVQMMIDKSDTIQNESLYGNCKNCGAPISRSGKCEYCGTMYRTI